MTGDRICINATLILWLVWGVYWLARSWGGAKTEKSESHAARVTHLLPLVVGFVLLYADQTSATPLDALLWPRDGIPGLTGVLLVLAGLVFAFWARGHLGKYWSGIITLKEGHKLIRTGPYRYARHPIYTGVLFAFLGSALAVGNGRGILAFVIVTIAFYIKSKREERNLISHFGEEYVRFQREVKGIVPYVF